MLVVSITEIHVMNSNLSKVFKVIIKNKGCKSGKIQPIFPNTMPLLITNEQEKKQNLAREKVTGPNNLKQFNVSVHQLLARQPHCSDL